MEKTFERLLTGVYFTVKTMQSPVESHAFCLSLFDAHLKKLPPRLQLAMMPEEICSTSRFKKKNYIFKITVHYKEALIMRLANFNLYIPCLILALFVFSQLLMLPFMLIFGFLAKLGILSQNGLFTTPWQFYLPHLLTFVLVTYIFLKRDISPVVRKTTHESRYQFGQKLIGVMNIIVAIAIVLPIIISKLSHNSENMLYMRFAIPIIGIGFCVWLAGIYMVLSSKA